jgi:hypothetical protein
MNVRNEKEGRLIALERMLDDRRKAGKRRTATDYTTAERPIAQGRR